MTWTYVLALVFGIGFVAGLRSMTAPAAVGVGTYLGWLSLKGTPFEFMGLGITVTIFSTLAVVEYITDKLPGTPSRTKPGPLIARIVMGGLSGACISVSAGQSLMGGAVVGGVGGVVGAFAGYEVRKRLVRGLRVKDAVFAIFEDVTAIVLAFLIVSPR
jgi:uncharacterized membrane protein